MHKPDITRAVMGLYQIDKNAKEIERLYKENISLRAEVDRFCPHEVTRSERNYCEGGYDYLSSVTIRTYCKRCDKLLNSENDKNHVGHYA